MKHWNIFVLEEKEKEEEEDTIFSHKIDHSFANLITKFPLFDIWS